MGSLAKLMQRAELQNSVVNLAIALVLAGAVARPALARDANTIEPVERPAANVTVLPENPSHRFWDTENKVLFATTAGFAAADFASTRANLANGGQELNPVTRVFAGSTAGLAANFAGETAGVIGLSYFFHKTGHHKLERIVPLASIGASGFAVSYNLTHR
jgi:hypothetical protein